MIVTMLCSLQILNLLVWTICKLDLCIFWYSGYCLSYFVSIISSGYFGACFLQFHWFPFHYLWKENSCYQGLFTLDIFTRTYIHFYKDLYIYILLFTLLITVIITFKRENMNISTLCCSTHGYNLATLFLLLVLDREII